MEDWKITMENAWVLLNLNKVWWCRLASVFLCRIDTFSGSDLTARSLRCSSISEKFDKSCKLLCASKSHGNRQKASCQTLRPALHKFLGITPSFTVAKAAEHCRRSFKSRTERVPNASSAKANSPREQFCTWLQGRRYPNKTHQATLPGATNLVFFSASWSKRCDAWTVKCSQSWNPKGWRNAGFLS